MSRADRVAHAIQKEVSLVIHEKLRDPRLGFVTITRVEMAPDLRLAKIFYSVLGNEDAYKKTREALESASGFIRARIAEAIRLRFVPEILFKDDHSAENSVRIQQILDELHQNDEPKKSRRVRKKV